MGTCGSGVCPSKSKPSAPGSLSEPKECCSYLSKSSGSSSSNGQSEGCEQWEKS